MLYVSYSKIPAVMRLIYTRLIWSLSAYIVARCLYIAQKCYYNDDADDLVMDMANQFISQIFLLWYVPHINSRPCIREC